jgi:hypothetical protein
MLLLEVTPLVTFPSKNTYAIRLLTLTTTILKLQKMEFSICHGAELLIRLSVLISKSKELC